MTTGNQAQHRDGPAEDVGASGPGVDVDVVVVGAGFAGMYLIHRLRGLGLSVRCLEAADDVGGTWYWNRYPGARCDIRSIDYSYSFDPDLDDEWTWSEKYATQPEILRYAAHVAERFDLRRDISFECRVDAAAWDEDEAVWRITTEPGLTITSRFYIMATGCLSLPKTPEFEGYDRYRGEVYFTGRWPHENVDFGGKRVAVIGTGSSAIQSIPLIAEQAKTLTVFQRTPNFSIPAHNGPIPHSELAEVAGRRAEYREEARWSRGGVPGETTEISGLSLTAEEQRTLLDQAWDKGTLFSILGVFSDVLVNEGSNEVVADYLRGRIRDIVDDPVTAEMLCPTDHPFGTKRPCLDSGYYATFNRPTVRLVDIRADPIAELTESGIRTGTETFEFDAIVFATGFDAMTGALVGVDITGRDGLSLADKWADGPVTYLGLTVVGFPNFFAITGPGSPSVLSNMMVSIEQHVDWVCDGIADLLSDGLATIEPSPEAEAGWGRHVNDGADITLYPRANSWYMGANVPGKPRVFLPYVGGVDFYRRACDEVREREYLGFIRRGADGTTKRSDGLVRELQPDVQLLLEFMAEMELPPLESMSPADARAFAEASAEVRPPGPDVGEVVDGELPGPDGPLRYRLYRPQGSGPHPITVYFHGGGWVLGSEVSDDPFCRDLCVRSGSIVVSVDYRHGPDHRFPAAHEDAVAALGWVAQHRAELGGTDRPVAVAGWSAGANLAAAACHVARDTGGPEIAGQLLVTPVTDGDVSRSSYAENGEGYVLTRSLMDWFFDNYVDSGQRQDPRLAPLLADDLSNLPPSLVVTCQFDPLRDEGAAYAEALAAAGNSAVHLPARGHIHTSLTMVDVVISGAPVRAEMAAALQRFHAADRSPANAADAASSAVGASGG